MHAYCKLQFYFRSENWMHRILRIRFAWTHVKNKICISKFEAKRKFIKFVFLAQGPGNIAV